ncbi:MAG: hypothetical protein LQ343_001985 [Gyalolechia ehrenbergii]|nr:MAG: hypothetical protein LQ343_001985 [Gyalolechia ehrenbergii]
MVCKDCASGTVHTGTPTGRVETLHNVPTYITSPSNDTPIKATIIMIPDAFGWEMPNSRLLCDTYAKRVNATVYLPEFQGGYHLPLSVMGDMRDMTAEGGWMIGKIPSVARIVYHMAPYLFNTRFSVTSPRIHAFFTAVRESTSLPIFAAGFCWGGLHAVNLTHATSTTPSGTPLVDAAFTAHPSALTVPGDLEKAEKPLSISNGTKDFVLDMKGVESVKAVFARKNEEEGGKGRFELNVVEGAKHGFAVRGNPGDEEEMKQAQVAEDQAVEWFRRWTEEGRKG